MHRHLAHALGATALGALLLQPVTTLADPPAHARNESSASYRGYAQSQPQYDERDRHWDDDHDHDRRGDCDHRHAYPRYYYPRPGYVVYRLPPNTRVVHRHGHRYYYSHGVWYRPFGPRYVVVGPPYRGW